MIDPSVKPGNDAAGIFDWHRAIDARTDPGSLCVIGAPSDAGNAISRGTAVGPAAIRQASKDRAAVTGSGCDIGDVDFKGQLGSKCHLEVTTKAIRRIIAADRVPIMLGGDHSLSFAPVSVLQEWEDICLVWFDAHTDFSPWHGGDFHNHKQVLRRIEALPGITQLVQLGYRGITVGDERRLGPKARVMTSAGMKRSEAQDIVDLIPSHVPCYLSIDIDVIDPFLAPGTSAPVPGGVIPEKVEAILEKLTQQRRIVGVDIVEVNPALDRNGDTSRIAVSFINAIAANWPYQAALSLVRPSASQPDCPGGKEWAQ